MSWLVRLTNVILFLADLVKKKEKFPENHCDINTIFFSLASNFA